MKPEDVFLAQYKTSTSAGNHNIRYHFWSNKHVREHQHDFFELFIVTENRLLHTFNGESESIEKGTLCLLRPGDVHKIKNFPGEPSTHFSISISKSAFEEMCRLISPNLYSLLMQYPQLISYKLTAREYDYFQYCIVEQSHTANTMTPMVMAVAQTFLAYLQMHFAHLQTVQTSWPQWFIEFIEKLSLPEIFRQPLSKIYALSPYSQPHLNEFFKQFKKQTLIQYVTKQKVNYACTLLTTTNYKISYIADIAGFNSLSGFNHIFKKNMGVSPSEYQKEHLKTGMF